MRRSSLIGMAVVVGCASAPMRSGALIDQYARAACVPARRGAPLSGHDSEWDQVIHGPGGCTARVIGAVQSTGFVGVEYPPDKAWHSVSAFGEKSNPIDVRLDAGSCRLYVRSGGSPIFVTNLKDIPIWLVEYDLRNRRELQSAKVDPQVLPPECPELPEAR